MTIPRRVRRPAGPSRGRTSGALPSYTPRGSSRAVAYPIMMLPPDMARLDRAAPGDAAGPSEGLPREGRGTATMSLMEDDPQTVQTEPIRLLTQVTCPHCWETFPPEQVLWISEHVELLGDPMLGPERQQRFLPSRFTVDGDAIDAQGMTCRSLACPHCHLAVPRGHAGDGAAVPLDPGQPGQRQVVLPDDDDLAIAPGPADAFPGGVHRRRPGVEPDPQRVRGVAVPPPRRDRS